MENAVANPKEKILGQPIFSICFYKDYLLIAAGGGGSKVGLKNKIICFKYDGIAFKDEVHSEEIKDGIPLCIDSLDSKNLFCACSDNKTYFYEIESHSGFFFEILKVETAEYFDDDFYQNICRLDQSGNYLYTATTDGKLKVWNLTIENKMPNINFKQDIQAHSRLINDILVLNEKNFIITASADGCTKIFDIKTLNVLKSLNFRENADNKNLSMRSLCFDSTNHYLYTLSAPMERGNSYVTIWDTKNNFNPILTKYVYDSQCGYICYNNKDTLAIGCGDGSIVWVESKNLSLIKIEEKHGFCVKTMKFKNNKLVSGAPDFRLIINDIPSVGLFVSYMKYLIYLSIIVLVFAYSLRKNNPN